MKPANQQRPKYYDLNLAHLPAPGLASIFHRISGALLFLPVIPGLLYLMQATLGSEAGYQHWRGILAMGPVKVILLGFAWLYCHHFFAGIRYLALDLHKGVDKDSARRTGVAVLVAGAATTLWLGAKIW